MSGLGRALLIAACSPALGPERGRALAEHEGLAVLLLVAGADGVVERGTASFERRWLARPPAAAAEE